MHPRRNHRQVRPKRTEPHELFFLIAYTHNMKSPPEVVFVSVTRLHVRTWRFLPSFLVYTFRSRRQVEVSAGFLGGRLATEFPFGFWTITVWADEQAMREFRNTADHLKAMPRLLDWCDEASYAHWQQDDASVPSAAVAFERLRDTGKLSKVRHPSAAHTSGKTAPCGEAKPGPELGKPLNPIT
jgi:hypothetical protein